MNAAVGADERLVVMLEARITEFEKRMRQAEQRGTQTYQGLARNSRSATRQMEQDMIRSTGRINQALASTSTQIGSFGKAFIGGAIAGAATAALAAVTTNVVATTRSMAELGNEAKRAGLSTDAFQEWKFLADQNRIAVDALVDGFKELSLRADEFIVTGAGPAAEAFARLGYRSEDLKKKLKDPSALMMEILGRLEGFDKAAQIRIADEVFGGTGGERFVELLGQGQGALQATIDKAHETGAVLDAELIAKADEVDRKFNELAASASNFAKRVAVGIAAAGVEFADLRDRLENIVPEDEGRAIFGDELYDAMAANRDLVDDNAEAIASLNREYSGLTDQALQMVPALMEAAARMEQMGQSDVAGALRDAAGQMDEVVAAFRRGDIEGEQLTVRLDEIKIYANDAFQALSDTDRVQFGGVMGRLGALGDVIAGVASRARDMAAAIASAAGISAGQKQGQALRDRHDAEAASMASMEAQRTAVEKFTAAEEARNSATAEQLRLQQEIEAVQKRAAAAGATLTPQQASDLASASLAGAAARSAAGKGGGGSKGGKSGGAGKAAVDEFAKEAQAIRDRTASLEAEAAVLVAVAASGKEYGDALEFARAKAELLHAAQKQGKEITPALEAEIDKLADAYVQAGLKAEGAADKLDLLKERSRAGKDALTDMFGSIIDGSMSAKDAVAQLLMEIAKTQMINGLMGLPGMGGLASGIGGLLIPGYASGGSHKGGLRIVGERGPELEATGPARIWNADQTRNLLAGRQGGTSIAAAPTVNFAPVTNLTVEGNADHKTLTAMQQMIRMNNEQMKRDLPGILDNHNKRSR